jgi:hypothetical protein
VSNRFLPVSSLYSPHFPHPISPIPSPILGSRSGCSIPARPGHGVQKERAPLSLNQSIGVTGWLLSLFSLYSPHFPRLISPIPAPIWDSRCVCSVSRSSWPGRPKSPRATTWTPKRRPGRLGGPIWTPLTAVQGEHDALTFPGAPTLRRRLGDA